MESPQSSTDRQRETYYVIVLPDGELVWGWHTKPEQHYEARFATEEEAVYFLNNAAVSYNVAQPMGTPEYKYLRDIGRVERVERG